MAIEFSQENWNRIIDRSNRWWSGSLGKPLIQVYLTDKNKPLTPPIPSFLPFYPFDASASEIVANWQRHLERQIYLGDAFPQVWLNFGPGVIAAYMGAEIENGDETVWFHPTQINEVKDIKFNYIADNKWLLKTKSIINEAINTWQGQVQIGLTDLGGNLDILSSFRPSERLIFDLYDCPEDVKRLTWRAHELWWRYFEEFEAMQAGINPGYSSWAGIFSQKRHYMLQCDFCYMIGPDMFEEFVKPELAASAKKLDNAFYHLDGPGELAHLNSLLEIDCLKGIQWIPGAGAADNTGWQDVYRKISDAGKKIQLFSHHSEKPFDEVLDIITDQIGRADNIVYTINADISERPKVEKLLERYC